MGRVWVFGLVSLLASQASAGQFMGRLRLQIGQEYDSNALRVYGEDIADDFLTRVVVQGQIGYSHLAHRLSLEYQGGAKLFYQETNEHLIANRVLASYRHDLSGHRAVGCRLGIRDVTQAEHNRDYLLLNGEIYLRMRPGEPVSLEVFTGGRDFEFKPDTDESILRFSHTGAHVGLRIQSDFSRSWAAWLTYQFDVRFYDVAAIEQVGEELQRESFDRQDLRHVGGLLVRYQTNWLRNWRLIVQGSYWLSYNDSNSFASSAVWHRLRAVIAFQLPLDLTLHLMGTLQFTDYSDGFLFDKNTYVVDADENENSIIAKLTYRLWEELNLVLQVAVYRDAFQHANSDQAPFSRETVMLGVSYGWAF